MRPVSAIATTLVFRSFTTTRCAMLQHQFTSLSLAFVLAVVATHPGAANDGSAELGIGGLVLTKSANIEMRTGRSSMGCARMAPTHLVTSRSTASANANGSSRGMTSGAKTNFLPKKSEVAAVNRDAARAALPPAEAVLNEVSLAASGRDLETEPRQRIVPQIAVGRLRPSRIHGALADSERSHREPFSKHIVSTLKEKPAPHFGC